MDTVLISNPNSTSITSRSLRSIIPTLKQLSDDDPSTSLVSYFTNHKGHAEVLARQAKKSGKDCVIVIGGDGTVNEVINGLLSTDEGSMPDPATLPLLGIIPTGSANVFARSLGYSHTPKKAVSQLVEAIRNGSERTVGIGTWQPQTSNTRHFFGVNVGFGIDADVIQAMDSARASGTVASPWRYARLTLRLWMQMMLHPPHITVKVRKTGSPAEPFEQSDVPVAFVSLTDPWTFMGAIPVRTVPGSSIDDGLSVFTLNTMVGARVVAAAAGLVFPPAARFAGDVRRTFSGAQHVTLTLSGPEVETEPQREFQVDGEHKDLTTYFDEGTYRQVELGFEPDALRVVSPR